MNIERDEIHHRNARYDDQVHSEDGKYEDREWLLYSSSGQVSLTLPDMMPTVRISLVSALYQGLLAEVLLLRRY